MKNVRKKYKPDRTVVNQNCSNENAIATVKSIINTLNKFPLIDSSNVLADFKFDSKGNICGLHLEIDQD